MAKLITASYKQRKFVKEYLRTGSIKKAALASYDTTEKNAYKVGEKALSKPTTQEYMKRIMDQAGLTDEYVANGLKFIAEAGMSPNSIKLANPSHGLKALETIAKLKDLYPAEKKNIKKTTITANLEGMTMDELREKIDKLAEEAKTFSKLLGKDITNAEIVP